MKRKQHHTPWIKLVIPSITPPSLKDNSGDVDRLVKALKKTLQTDTLVVDFALVKKIPHSLRKSRYEIAAAVYMRPNGWQLIDIYPSSDVVSLFGLAVDLGSSTVVVRLYNLSTREKIDETTFHNPQ